MSAGGGAIVTGASSGVGAAVALALAQSGMPVAAVARRVERLKSVVAPINEAGGHAFVVPADLLDSEAAIDAMDRCCRELGKVDAIVICHGTNVPRRRLDEMSVGDWDAVVGTNLSSVFYCLRPVLQTMRGQGGGRVVAISSVAGLRPSALSGAAYSASKAGVNALCECINLEEREHNISACIIAPGDINTEILDKRPVPPSAAQRASMLQPQDIARLVLSAVTQPGHVLIEQTVVRPMST